MAKKYDIFDAASWLLDETYSIYEDAKEEATETASDETDETEDDSDGGIAEERGVKGCFRENGYGTGKKYDAAAG